MFYTSSLEIITESNENWFNVQKELIVLEHMAIVNEDTVLLEEAKDGFFEKVKTFFKNMIEKIKELIAKFIKWVKEKLAALKAKFKKGKKGEDTKSTEKTSDNKKEIKSKTLLLNAPVEKPADPGTDIVVAKKSNNTIQYNNEVSNLVRRFNANLRTSSQGAYKSAVQGVSLEEFKKEADTGLSIQKDYLEKFRKEIKVNFSDLNRYYDEMQKCSSMIHDQGDEIQKMVSAAESRIKACGSDRQQEAQKVFDFIKVVLNLSTQCLGLLMQEVQFNIGQLATVK